MKIRHDIMWDGRDVLDSSCEFADSAGCKGCMLLPGHSHGEPEPENIA